MKMYDGQAWHWLHSTVNGSINNTEAVSYGHYVQVVVAEVIIVS